MSKKKTATVIGILALIGIGLWATTAKAADDDDERPDDDEDDERPVGPFPAYPVEPGEPDTPIGPFPAYPVEDPTLIVNKYLCPLRPNCRDGSLYQIASGDNPTEIAKAVLRNSVPSDKVGELTPPYVAQMSVHSFNLALYSCIWEPIDPNAKASLSRMGRSGDPPRTVPQRYTDKEYDAGGTIRRWYVGDAFMPQHFNNLTRMRGGNEPLRSTDERGRNLEGGGSYGLLWLPKILDFKPAPYATITVDADLPPDLAALAPNIYG